MELHEAVLAIYGGHMYKITDLNQLSQAIDLNFIKSLYKQRNFFSLKKNA